MSWHVERRGHVLVSWSLTNSLGKTVRHPLRTIKSEGQIKSNVIDKKKLIDTHYGAIAAKAVLMKPKDLVVQEKAQEEFEKQLLGADSALRVRSHCICFCDKS